MCVYVFFNNYIFKKNIQNINEVSGIYSQSFGQKNNKMGEKNVYAYDPLHTRYTLGCILPPIELIG